MSATPDELAMIDAFIDRELDGPDAERIARAIEERADLKAYADRQRGLKARLDEAFAEASASPVPKDLIDLVRRSPMPVTGGYRARDQVTAQAWRALPIAAAILISLGLGLYLGNGPTSGLIGIDGNGTITANGALATALATQLAADDQHSISIGLSFRAKDGQMCRTFAARGGAQGLAGIACRGNNGWTIAGLASAEGAFADPSKFQTAGAALPQSLRDRVKAMISGDVLNTAEERAARERGWRAQ